MNIELNDIEIRVLGCLIEKERATPDYYPLTLNALTNACNQKSNRNPPMMLAEKSIVKALDSLRMDHHLSVQVTSTESRVPKYKHNIRNHWEFSQEELAIICELFLRGPQTPGDLRARSSRLYPFKDKEQVQMVLEQLVTREDGPMVTQLPREPGKREQRWAHLFAGEPKIPDEYPAEIRPEPVRIEIDAENKRIEQLEQEVVTLKKEFSSLRDEFVQFKTAFE